MKDLYLECARCGDIANVLTTIPMNEFIPTKTKDGEDNVKIVSKRIEVCTPCLKIIAKEARHG